MNFGLQRHRFARSSAVLGVLLLSGFPCAAEAAPPDRSESPPSEISLQQVHMIETRDGAKLWEIRADQVEVNERKGFTILTRVSRPIQIAFYSSQGRATCVADRATLDLTTKNVRLEGSVVARSEQGMELKTEQLQWIAASRRLENDQVVTITRGTMVTRGRGMEAETDLERVRIFQDITSQVRPVSAPASKRSRAQ